MIKSFYDFWGRKCPVSVLPPADAHGMEKCLNPVLILLFSEIQNPVLDLANLDNSP